jgi:NodT family efflux transporter outer membrane factor (OMF) lipoprotein
MKPVRKPISTLLAASTLAASLVGCRVGPKYVRPSTPAPPAFKESAPAAYTSAGNDAWRPASPSDGLLKGKWWEIFHEPELNALEDTLNIDNQNIAVSFQNFMAARAQVKQARAGYFPTLSVAPDYTRTKRPSTLRGVGVSSGTSGTTTGSGISTSSTGTSTSISLPFDVSWAPDLWGKIQNQVRESQYATQVSAADLENERLTEQASLAEFYFELRGQDSLQQIYNATIEADRKSLDLTRTLVATGIDNPESVAQAEVTLANAVEAGTGVATNRAIFEHAIATLIGKPASQVSLPIKNLTTPLPPIPVGVPSELLQRRPDIAAAERAMAEANAIVGIQQAAYYPSLSLTGTGGLSSSSITNLFSAPALLWSVGSTASETIFDAGLRRATIAQYTANFNADAASYKQTVLTAFQQVEDYIATLRVLSQQIAQQQVAVDAAQRYADIALSRYKAGLDPYLNVITAQTTLLSDQQTELILRVNQITAAVQLIQALGGGWDATQLPPAGQIAGGRCC